MTEEDAELQKLTKRLAIVAAVLTVLDSGLASALLLRLESAAEDMAVVAVGAAEAKVAPENNEPLVTFRVEPDGQNGEELVFTYRGKTLPGLEAVKAKKGSPVDKTRDFAVQYQLREMPRVLVREFGDMLLGTPKGELPAPKPWVAAVEKWRDKVAVEWYNEHVSPFVTWGKIYRYVAKYETYGGNKYLSQRYFDKNGKRVTDFTIPGRDSVRGPFEPEIYESASRPIETGPTDCKITKLPLKISNLSEMPCNATMKPAVELIKQNFETFLEFATLIPEAVFDKIPYELKSTLIDMGNRLEPQNREKAPITRDGDYWVSNAYDDGADYVSALVTPAKGVAGRFKYEISVDNQHNTIVLDLVTPTRYEILNSYHGGEASSYSPLFDFFDTGMDDTDRR